MEECRPIKLQQQAPHLHKAATISEEININTATMYVQQNDQKHFYFSRDDNFPWAFYCNSQTCQIFCSDILKSDY